LREVCGITIRKVFVIGVDGRDGEDRRVEYRKSNASCASRWISVNRWETSFERAAAPPGTGRESGADRARDADDAYVASGAVVPRGDRNGADGLGSGPMALRGAADGVSVSRDFPGNVSGPVRAARACARPLPR